MDPTSLPDLPKPSRTSGKSQKPQFQIPNFQRIIREQIFIFLILTCIGEFQPGNKTIYVVFDEESEFSGPRTPKLSLAKFLFKEKTYPKFRRTIRKKILIFLINLFWGDPPGEMDRSSHQANVIGIGLGTDRQKDRTQTERTATSSQSLATGRQPGTGPSPRGGPQKRE